MRAADSQAAEAGIPSSVLMEAAGQAVAEAARDRFPHARRVLVLCGKGNNGGDGYVAALHLTQEGRQVQLLEIGNEPTTADARQARDACLATEMHVQTLSLQSLEAHLGESEIVIDALLGSGFGRSLDGLLAEVVQVVRAAAVPVLSVDVPTGVDADRPYPPGPHLSADYTVQLAGAKLASALEPAATAFGAWQVADIGIPPSLLAANAVASLLEPDMVRPNLPTRAADAHKYRVGTVLVVGGSPRYLGAAELACRAAYRGGAGLVTLLADARLAGGWPEVVLEPLAGKTLADARRAIEPGRAQVLVIGPGLDGADPIELVRLLDLHHGPAVLDAGALIADEGLRLAVGRHGGCVLTPHHGEAARLLAVPVAEVRADPLAATRTLAGRWNTVVALKGASTVIANPAGTLSVSSSGHPGMAVGGAGDVLAGLIGAWLAGAVDTSLRTAAAVYVHGLAGEVAAERYGAGLVAGDLVESLPQAWSRLL